MRLAHLYWVAIISIRLVFRLMTGIRFSIRKASFFHVSRLVIIPMRLANPLFAYAGSFPRCDWPFVPYISARMVQFYWKLLYFPLFDLAGHYIDAAGDFTPSLRLVTSALDLLGWQFSTGNFFSDLIGWYFRLVLYFFAALARMVIPCRWI